MKTPADNTPDHISAIVNHETRANMHSSLCNSISEVSRMIENANYQHALAQEVPKRSDAKPTRLSRRNCRKASIACLACRARKVRCNVTEAQPCSNCRWNGAKCCTKPIRRKYSFSEPSSPRSKIQENSDKADPDSGSDSSCNNVPCDTESLSTPSEHSFDTAPGDMNSITDVPQTHSEESNIRLFPYYLRHLPEFITPPPNDFDPDALQHLSSQGALDLPPPSVQHALIRAFFDHVYPNLPIIDLKSFLGAVQTQGNCSHKISLLLFQAVLTAAVEYVDMSYLVNAGFRSRVTAFYQFSRKVKLLYNLDYERDRLCLLQTLLLMAQWPNNMHGHRNASYWLDIAISQAFAAKLHVEPSELAPCIPIEEQKIRRRIWWSCIMQDQLSITQDRAIPCIRKEDHDVRMLQEVDFMTEGSITASSNDELRKLCPFTNDPERIRQIAKSCIAQATLCQSLQCHFQGQIESIDNEVELENLFLSAYLPGSGDTTCNVNQERNFNLMQSTAYPGLVI